MKDTKAHEGKHYIEAPGAEATVDPLSGPHFSQRTREMGHPLFLPQSLHAIAVRGSFQYLELFLDFYDERSGLDG
jgi:hypothetical protein